MYKNSFRGFNKGISVNGANGGFSGRTGLQFVCNEFNKNQYDIYISQDAMVRPEQGSSAGGADNKFVATKISSIYSLTSQHITYYHCSGGNRTPYKPIGNIAVNGNATCSPDISTICDDSRLSADSLAQYKAMQLQYDQLLVELGENPDLLQELLILSDAMRELSDHAISRILHDSILYVDALKSWYEVVRTPIAKYWLSEVYASERNYEQAEAILRGIPPLFAFDESELIEHDNYMQFYHFKKQMYLSGRDWTELDEAEIAQLQRIAEATRGRSAGMAKGALCFFYDICYEDEFVAEGGMEEGRMPKDIATQSTIAGNDPQYELSLYPNPTPSEMTVALNNPAIKIVQMEVYDLTNRKVYQQTVNQSYGTLRMNELAQGIYILKVWLDQGDVVIRKVVKK